MQARPVLPARRAAARAPLAVSARATKQQAAYICVDCGVSVLHTRCGGCAKLADWMETYSMQECSMRGGDAH